MNISTEPWIPIVWGDGEPGTVSLCDVFKRGEEIRDLAVRPHERIAVMRSLICVAQAALNGPADQDDWKTCRAKTIPAALDYLKRWHCAFELFGDGQRFLQVPGLERPNGDDDEGIGNSISKLDLALATGNNSTLFDNGGGSEREFSEGRVTLLALTFQCFSPGGLIGVASWNSTETPGKGKSNHAPCIAGSMLHAMVRGDNLIDTIYRNLLTKVHVSGLFGKNTWGHPVWEQMPSELADTAAVQNATQTYLGRLVPLSRAIRLESDGRLLILANGLNYPPYPEWREPTATIKTRQTKNQLPTRVTLRCSVEKAAWRELHALAVIAVDKDSVGGPAALRDVSDGEAFDLWVGGLAASKAKLVDTIESVFHVPAAMLDEMSQRVYEQGVDWAELTGFRLSRAVSVYHREIGDDLNRPEFRDRRQQIQNKAAAQFWTDIEQIVPQLLQISEKPQKLGQPADWNNTDWGKAVWTAARAAYEQSCPHGTPRQMRAYALGLSSLYSAPAESAHSTIIEKEIEA